MIHAEKALQLPGAQPSDSDIDDARKMLAKLREHVLKYMAFGGPPPLEVPFRDLSKTAAQILCYVMKRFKWTVNANLIAEAPRFNGGQPVPHHWVLQLQPTVEVYDEVLAETLTALTQEPVLDA